MSLFDAVSVHAYWSTAGLTEWNALRWRRFTPRPSLVLVTECGRDRVRDGPGGTWLPSEQGDAFGWDKQGLSAEDFLEELRAYDAELRRDGAYGVVFTTSPDDEWSRKGFDCDVIASRADFTNLGPHDLEGRSPQALAWAARAGVVKSVDQTAAIRRAPASAITIYRRRFTPAEQDAILEAGDAARLVGAIDEGLEGFRHPKLYVELLNEVGKGRRDQYARLARAAVPLLRARGVRVAGPSWATGDYEQDDWAAFVAAATPTGGTMTADWYDGATRRLLTTNYTPGRAGRTPLLIVDHIADGLGSPFVWFNTDRGEAGSSAHFWVGRAGAVEQYRPLSDTCWASGNVNKPDLSNVHIAAIVQEGVNPNRISVSVEHEGKPGDVFPPAQIKASRQLHEWLSKTLSIPLTRERVVGHYQWDSVTRARCPGPTFPWAAILGGSPVPPTPDPTALQEQAWALGDQLQKLAPQYDAAGYPHRAAYVRSQGEALKEWVNTASKSQK